MPLNIDGKCPCMDPNAMPKQINVSGHGIAVVGLAEILDAVHKLNLTDEEKIKKELLERVKQRNWVPDSAQASYARALFAEYRKV